MQEGKEAGGESSPTGSSRLSPDVQSFRLNARNALKSDHFGIVGGSVTTDPFDYLCKLAEGDSPKVFL